MRKARFATDHAATGSFLEAMMAMMVVSCALCLLIYELPLLVPSQGTHDGLSDDAVRLRDQVLGQLVRSDGTVLEASLPGFELGLVKFTVASSCKLEIRTVASSGEDEVPYVLHAPAIVPQRLEACVVLYEPISLDAGGGLIKAAMLTVVVW